MKTTREQLLALVPGLYQARDAALDGAPFEALLDVLAEALSELDDAVEQLDDDHFAERASNRALDRLAVLVGARLLTDDERTKRGIVARTIGWRRRNGTLATIEEALGVTSGWSTEVEEAFRSLLIDQDLAHVVPWRGRTVVTWDPIALADPLSRRSPDAEPPREEAPVRSLLLEPLPDEEVDDTLRRLGRADVGRYAASPRTIDFDGWARPEVAVIRTTRVDTFAVERRELRTGRTLTSTLPGGPEVRVIDLHPQGAPMPLAWEQPLFRPDMTGGLTADHEPAPDPRPTRSVETLLTPTALAEDGDLAEEAGAFSLRVDGVLLVGPDPAAVGEGGLTCSGAGPEPVLRFADRGRPSPNERWTLHLLAVGDPDSLDAADSPNTTDALQDNVAIASADAEKGTAGPVDVHLEGGNSSVAHIRLARVGNPNGFRRDALGVWSGVPLSEGDRAPLGAAASFTRGGNPVVVRPVRRDAGTLGVSVHRPTGPARWLEGAAVGGDLPEVDPNAVGPVMGMAAGPDHAFVVGVREHGGNKVLGVWRIGPTGNLRRLVRVDDPGASSRVPPARANPSCCLHAGRLYVFGGLDDGIPLADLWSIDVSTGEWKNHRVRGTVARAGGVLLSTPSGLVLAGGATTAGVLEPSVVRCDPTRRRPVWRELAVLDVPEGPGTLVGRATGDDLHLLVWADRTWPVTATLPAGHEAFTLGPAERTGPNPPAEGEAVWIGDELLLLGPSPLPPSEVVFRADGEGAIAFLAAADLPLDGQAAVFEVRVDGSTRRFVPDGEAEPESYRLGLARYEPFPVRSAPAPRIGLPERIAWTPVLLRQRNLEPLGQGTTESALLLSEAVGLDPRIGRVALREDMAGVAHEASYRRARSATLGAGLTPWRREPDAAWLEPDLPLEVPIDLDEERPAGPADVDAWVSQRLAGTGTEARPIVDTIEAALAEAEGEERVVRISDSPLLRRTHLQAPRGTHTVLTSDEAGGVPWFRSDDGISLFVEPSLDEATGDPARVHLAGLALGGRLEVVLLDGALDLRWCELGGGVRVAGGAHQSPLARRSLTDVSLTITLTGCIVGRVELPPWVRLVASGCTFDGEGGPAIVAPGARLRLRHCTVHGSVTCGVLEASSSAFTAPVFTDRPDLGWLRYSVLQEQGRAPVRFRCVEAPLSLRSLRRTDPTYLLLAENNPESVLGAGESGRIPGAHGERAGALRELHERTRDHLPMGLEPHHIDRATQDLDRMGRRTT